MNARKSAKASGGWRISRVWIGIALLVAYGVLIFLDLPSPAGNRYRQDLPASELARWNVTPVPNAETAAHWWDKAQGLRGWSVFPEGWYWAKLVPAPLTHWLALLGIAILGVITLWLLQRWVRRLTWWTTGIELAALVVFSYLFQLGTLWLKGANPLQLLFNRILDPDFSGYLTSALHVGGLAAFFSQYDRTLLSPDWCSHCQTHMPAPVLFYWLALRLVGLLPLSWQTTTANALLAIGHVRAPDLAPATVIVALLGGHALLFMAAAITVPLYGLARLLVGDDHALALAALGTVLPAVDLMSPEFDPFYGTLAAFVLYAGLRGLGSPRHSGWWGVVAGLLIAFYLFWTVSLAVVIVGLLLLVPPALAGILGPGGGNTRTTLVRLPARSALYWLIGLGLGAGVPYLLLGTVGEMRLVSIFERLLTAQSRGITAVRPYVPWLIFNQVDFLQFLGLPLVAATLITAWRRRAYVSTVTLPGAETSPPGWPYWGLAGALTRVASAVNVYSVLFWGMLLVLDASGEVRAEVSRLWIPLAPLALLAVFQAAGRDQITKHQIYGILAAQLAVCVFIAGNWLTP